ncbi:metal-dependent hydrolase family protein [Amycolatopsis taiwanensis]|uniref:metal-dependent hydrolase family protein n=1 Tax=Amycolatopsis taiwanensis TaxID=342230 RepID=UPI0004881145|nr:amidohydrolase family protein [Amycolatopsis taiwanensis]
MTRTLFTGGHVFDGTGAPPQPADVAVEEGRIVAVGTGLDGDDVVDCTGSTVLPGLFDCHVHLMVNGLDPEGWRATPFSLPFFQAVHTMRATLAVGITTVRDACGADLGLQVAQQQGLIRGPRTFLSIEQLSQTGGQNDPWEPSGCLSPVFVPHPGRPDGVVDGPDQARRKVREMVRAGANVIKIATSGGVVSPRADPRAAHFGDDEVAMIVREAAAAGISVMSHAYSAEGIKIAVRNGVRSIEHGYFLDDEAIDLMLDRGSWLVPTLMAGPGTLRAAAAGMSVPEHMLANAKLITEASMDSVRRAVAAGVKIAMGTDTGVTPHGRNLDELPLMAACGMTHAQVLHAATLSAARLMRLDDELGSVEPGKRADLVVIRGGIEPDGMADRVVAVYQDGELVHQRATTGG